jgi:putative copper resistance protein D
VSPGLRAIGAGVAAALVAVVLAVVLRGSGAYDALGLADPGILVRLAVPGVRALADLAAAATVGGLLVALVIATPPPGAEAFSLPGRRALRIAAGAAWVWAVAAALSVPLSLADSTGGRLPSGAGVVTAMLARGEPVGWVVAAVLAAGAAVALGEIRTWSAGAGTLLAVVGALLAPVVTGHAVDGVGHDLATPATALHVVAAAAWLGTLGVLAALGIAPGERAGRLATGAAVLVVASGVLDVAVLAPDPGDLLTDYGALLLMMAALTVVVLATRWRRTARRGRVLGELVVLALVVGLSAVATRAVPPVQGAGHASTPEAVLGYGLAAAPTPEVLATSWRPDLWFAGLAVLLAGLYALGLRRIAREGGRWPLGRSAAWFAGCAVLVVATSSGLGRYGPAVLSVHVAGHMLTAVVVPLLWATAAPIVLARRTLVPAGDAAERSSTHRAGDGAPEGPAEWLEHVLAAPALRVATHPLVTVVAVVASPFVLYLTPLFALTQPVGWLQPLLTAWFLAVGVAFLGPLVAGDPAGRSLPPVARLTLLLASMPFHALFGLALVAGDHPISRTPTLVASSGGGQVFVDDFYQRLRLDWAPDLLADQHLAGVLSWVMGDVPLLIAVVVVLVGWSRSETDDHAVLAELR